MQFEIFPFLGLDTFIYLILQVTQLIFFTFKPQPLVFLHSWAILVKHDLYNSCSIMIMQSQRGKSMSFPSIMCVSKTIVGFKIQ
jgi:hypothetical protein